MWISADVVSETGAYAGVWASNVDFDDGTYAEYDLYVGYRRSIGDISYDLNLSRIDYPGTPESYEFYSIRGTARRDLEAGWLRAVLSVSPDGPAYYGAMRALELGGGLTLGRSSTLNGGVGVQQVDEFDLDYVWWHAGLTHRPLPDLAIDLRWWDNDSRGYGDSYSPRLVLSVSKEFTTN